VPYCEKLASEALRHRSHSFLLCNLNYTTPAFTSYSIHQMALPPIAITAVSLQLTTHLSTPREWKADLQRTVYPYKWLPIICRSGAGQWKFASQRPTFYHWATPPTMSSTLSWISCSIPVIPLPSSCLVNNSLMYYNRPALTSISAFAK